MGFTGDRGGDGDAGGEKWDVPIKVEVGEVAEWQNTQQWFRGENFTSGVPLVCECKGNTRSCLRE